eukprot:CAMPEP_0184703634 /NCGR_PEP_ID=MMETSP0313-20130426/28510_1 /TAXON_ID=2792 /ORGANISM="Porphyridium aerugineum, Strain SAG 1380-2" /LENGTH=171 /DNA_ID=CAMNT_0027164455 /DNA_START=490 /DNA_END=1005 /DNA_ORIENTATION=-
MAKLTLLIMLKCINLVRHGINYVPVKKYCDRMIQKGEAMNPNPDPVSNATLYVIRRLMYADAEKILTTKGPMPFRPIDEFLQSIWTKERRVINEVAFVIGFVRVHDIAKEVFEVRPPMRRNVKFEDFALAGLFNSKAPETQLVFLDITFLDHNMRISSVRKDHVFELIKKD